MTLIDEDIRLTVYRLGSALAKATREALELRLATLRKDQAAQESRLR